MNRLDIKTLGISEMQWLNSEQRRIGEHGVYFSGSDGSGGESFIITKDIEKLVIKFIPH